MEKWYYKWVLLSLLLIVSGCAHHAVEKPEQGEEVTTLEPKQPETPPIVPLNPRIIEAKLHIEISNIRVLTGEMLKRDNLSKGIPEQSPPQFHIWASGISQRPSQTVLDLDLEGPAPRDIFVDPENQNQVFYWNLTSLLKNNKKISIVRKITVQSSELYPLIDTTNCLTYNFSDEEYQFYTKSEPFIEITKAIRSTAEKIAGYEPNPYKKAELIFNWVSENMVYKFPPPGRGANNALRNLKGDSGQYAFLFIALCRALGIPARFVTGFCVKDEPELVYQAWAEFYLPSHGWLPADPTMGKSQFGKINNRRIVASVGNNIHLKYAPYWATYANSEVENSCTYFMQVATIVHSGIRAKIRTWIETIRFAEPENELLMIDKQ